MDPLPCGHVAVAATRRLCPHLVGRPEDEDLEHFRHLTGRGVEWDAYCKGCAATGDRRLLSVCEGCAARLEDEETDQLGYVGRPEIRDRSEPVDAGVTAALLPAELRCAVDLAPLPGSDAYNFLDGARVVDVATGDDSLSFAGPRGSHFFSDGHRLYASDGAGLEVWDFRTGERTAGLPGFSPTHHHPVARQLARLDGDQLLTR